MYTAGIFRTRVFQSAHVGRLSVARKDNTRFISAGFASFRSLTSLALFTGTIAFMLLERMRK